MKGQIVGGVFALTLTAYIFFAEKLRQIGEDNADYYDATFELREKYFKDLKFIAALVGLCILLCIIGIFTITKNQNLLTFILNLSSLLFIVCIGSILYFGIILLDPHKIDNEVRNLGKSVESNYPVNEKDESATLEQFLSAYNNLEKTVMEISENLYGLYLSKDNQFGRYKPQIIQALNILHRFEIIDKKTVSKINEIRMYRNSIVHGVENFEISKTICLEIKNIDEEIHSKVENQYVDTD